MSGRSKAYAARGKSVAKAAVYATPVRAVARRIWEQKDPIVYGAIQKRGFGHVLARLASESLPDRQFFAKLTIEDWQSFDGQPFLLRAGEKRLYGNTVEAPQRGFPLIYRNIVVPSDDPTSFSLSIPAKYKLQFSRAPFTTAEQEKYDEKYGIQQKHGFHYSLRGNLDSPRKLIVTFPGFGPSTSRISYAVTYLQQLSGQDLADTAVLCLQDRYGVAGTYFVSDSGERPLLERLTEFLKQTARSLKIAEQDIVFFGASKGGSIALMAADQFPTATMVVAVPQLNLPYYLSKPFFANNLGLNPAFRATVQPQQLLKKYLLENRSIHYFYTNDDELSNYSGIEFPVSHGQLEKYRFSGSHGEVARKALPAMLGVIRSFIRRQKTSSLGSVDVHVSTSGSRSALQFRTEGYSEDVVAGEAIRFLRLDSANGRVHLATSSSALPMVGYLSPEESLAPGLDSADSTLTIVEISRTGLIRESTVLNELPKEIREALPASPQAGELSLSPGGERGYSVVERFDVVAFHYEVFEHLDAPNGVVVRYGSTGSDRWRLPPEQTVRYEVHVTSREPSRLIVALGRRLAVLANTTNLKLSVQQEWHTAEVRAAVSESDWPGLASWGG